MIDIPFTFGIITDASPEACERLPVVINSIRQLHIPEYQILIVGPKEKIHTLQYLGKEEPFLDVIDFDDSIKKAWITKKKNLITQHAKFENIVYQHDYIIYTSTWYEGWKKFGDDFKACMNPIFNTDGKRYRDWSLFPDVFFEKVRDYSGFQKLECLLPYKETELSRWMYFSGGYWVAKKSVMEEFPLNETLTWGRGEDADWSYRFREKYNFSINHHSVVEIYKKWHDPAFTVIRPEVLEKIKEYKDMQDDGRALPNMTLHEHNLFAYYQEEKERDLRYRYPLNDHSIVFDLGAFRGEFAEKMIQRYQASVYAFEPVPEFAESLKTKIDREGRLKVFPFALGGEKRKEMINVSLDGSSFFQEGSNQIEIQIESISEFIRAHNLKFINLIKINVEGAEYEIMERLIKDKMLNMFGNFQIQFHPVVENHKERRKFIQNELSRTHHLTYNFDYVWENWELNL